MSDLHRGYLPDGKDRQHPVNDPDASDVYAMPPAAPSLGGIATWYAIAGASTTPSIPVPMIRKWG